METIFLNKCIFFLKCVTELGERELNAVLNELEPIIS